MLVLVRLKYSSVIVLMKHMPKNCAHYKQNRTQKQERTKLEVFSTSNYNGYVTECRGSLSNQNFVDLIQIISVFCNIYLLACPLS